MLHSLITLLKRPGKLRMSSPLNHDQDETQGLHCNNLRCRVLLPSPGSRIGWATYCSHLLCGQCGEEAQRQGVCLACQTDLRSSAPSSSRTQSERKMSRVILAPTESEKKFLMAGMRPSDIMEVARAGLAFYEHQRGIEVKHMKSRISKLEMENEDLKRKEARNYVTANGP